MLSKVSTLTALAGALALLAAPAAVADGLPVINLDTTETGVTAPADGTRYYALADRGLTQVVRIEPHDGEGSLQRLRLRGTLAVPGVAFDGTTSGLSADGETLVLIEPRQTFPRAETTLVAVETDRMRDFERIELDGDYSFDAISPDGSVIYLVHYPNPRDPTRYEVRAYDNEDGRLRPDPILDTRTAPQVMRGFPLARQGSADGVWAYTLYDGAGDGPFVHALNTAEGTALCIDLDHLARMRNPSKLSLAELEGDGPLEVVDRKGEVKASIDTSSWEVTPPVDQAEDADGDGGGLPAGLIIPAGAIALVPIAGALVRRRRRA